MGGGFLGDEAVDGGLEIDDGVEDTALQSTRAEFGEKPLDGVEPEPRGSCEVEDETRVAIEPGTTFGCLWAARDLAMFNLAIVSKLRGCRSSRAKERPLCLQRSRE